MMVSCAKRFREKLSDLLHGDVRVKSRSHAYKIITKCF